MIASIVITSYSIHYTKLYEGDIDGVDYKYTTLTSDVTYEDFYNIAKAYLDELKDDSVIKNLLMKYSITEEDYNTQIQAAIDSRNNFV